MDNKDFSIHISTKSIVVVLAVIFGLITSIFLLNKIDNSRKYKQFLDMNKKAKASFHLQILDSLTYQFDMNDSIRKDEIHEQLELLPRDATEINSCSLIIPGDGKMHIIDSYSRNDRTVNYLPKKQEQLIQLLDKPKRGGIEKQIFDITVEDKQIWTMVKLKNAYLISRKYRY